MSSRYYVTLKERGGCAVRAIGNWHYVMCDQEISPIESSVRVLCEHPRRVTCVRCLATEVVMRAEDAALAGTRR